MNCVECGADTEPGPLCQKCQLEKRKRPVIPEFVDLTVCGGCGATLSGGTWREVELEDAAAAVIATGLEKKVDLAGVKVELEEEASNIYFAKVLVRSRAGGAVQRDELSCRLRLQVGTCETCGRLSGNYFECIIQIRADGRLPSEDEVEECRSYVEKRIDAARSGDRTVFLSKAEEVKGGLDMYLSSNQLGQGIARDLADRRGAQYSASNELFGQKDGREIFRMTFLVRLPSYWQGSFAVLGERIVQVHNIGPKRTALRYLDTWEDVSLTNKDLAGTRVLGGGEMVREAVVLAETETEVQLLDPDTNKVVDVVKPRGWRLQGEAAKFVRHDEGFYLV
ncbi:MAG: 60S ribosomal export protein NMD3 [Methanobacteriota archaeon]